MRVKDDFFIKVIEELRSNYFPNEVHQTENKQYWNVTLAVENFNNGCLCYSNLIKVVAKNCKTSEKEIEEIVDKYINF